MNCSFPKNLRQLRTERKLHQLQLADALYTTQRRISYWESGKIEPDIESLIQIADFFEVTLDELVGRK